MSMIQIKCPFCSAVLSVQNIPGIENKFITCPVCKHKQPFTAYKTPKPVSYGDHTEYPKSFGGAKNSDDTEVGGNNLSGSTPIGMLTLQNTLQKFQLKQGRNVVGRKADSSTADFQIDTGTSRRMSREHIVIEVTNVPSRGITHYVSLFRERVNKTYVGIEELVFGDRIILKTGSVIKLPDAELLFEIPDDDATSFG